MKLTPSLLAAALAASATLAGYGVIESKQSRLASPAPAATSPATPPSVAPAAGDREVLCELEDAPLEPVAVEPTPAPQEIAWNQDVPDPLKPTWNHYYGDNCGPCVAEAVHFDDPAVIAEAQKYNCNLILATDGSIPRDEFFRPKSDYGNGGRRLSVGWDVSKGADWLATILRKTHAELTKPLPQKSVMRPLKRIAGALR
jgi:hypothetical protein